MTGRTYPEYQRAPDAWMGEVPAHWGLERMKYGLTEKTTKKGPDLPPGAISYGKVVMKDAEKIAPETRATYQEVLAGEYLINPINLNYDLVSLRTALSEMDVCVSPAYIVLRAIPEKVHPVFGNYVLHVFDVCHMKTLGAGVRQTITFKDIGQCVWPLPPMEEQTAIAHFLDRETGLIDGLIEKKTRFIALLKEKRAAVITHAVTKGVPRINGDETQSKAGHLEDTRLDQIFSEVTNLVPLDGIDLLTPSVVHGVVPQASLGMRPQQALRENYRVNLAQPDDFVISLSSHAHGIEHCGLEGGVSPDYTLLRPKCDPGLIPFLRYALKSSWIIFQLGAFKTGVRMGLRLTWNKVRYCKIGLPSSEVAERIADYLDGETSRIDGLITLTERSIDLLREKRAALITAAVSGKIDVRAAA